MCEAPQTGSNAKPDDTFAQVVNRIDELESNYLEKFDSTIATLLYIYWF